MSNLISQRCIIWKKRVSICIIKLFKAYKAKDIKTIIVPQYEELSPKVIYPKIKSYYTEIIKYFPDYPEEMDYLPPKKFIWDVFSTFNNKTAEKFISHALKQRNEEVKEGDKTVEVWEDVLNQLHSANYFSKKKGKALYMLKASKVYTKVQRKRKKKFEALDLTKEEKEHWITKRKKMNESYKIAEWLENSKSKQSEPDEEERMKKMMIIVKKWT